MSFADYQRKVYGFNQRELHEWHRTRFIAYTLSLPNFDKGKAPTIQEFLPLDGDKVEKKTVKVIETQEEFDAIFYAYNPKLKKDGRISSTIDNH